MSSALSPFARYWTTSQTMIRVPLTQGFPWQIRGSMRMRSRLDTSFESLTDLGEDANPICCGPEPRVRAASAKGPSPLGGGG